MKWPGKLLLTLLLVIIFTLISLYAVLQTTWGAAWISRTVTERTPYHLSVGKVSHSFSTPSHLILSRVNFGHKGQPASLVAKQIDLGLSLDQLVTPNHFSSISLDNGTLKIDDNSPLSSAINADRLQLNEMAILTPQGIVASNVTGGIAPWLPSQEEHAKFRLSAKSVDYAGTQATNVLLQGSIQQQQIIISDAGADVALGSVTFNNARRDAQHQWHVSALRLSDIRWQSDRKLSEFIVPSFPLPAVTFDRIDVTNARMEGAGWAVNDLDLVLKNATLQDGGWHSNAGSLSMNANTLISGDISLTEPIVNLDFTPEGVNINQLSSRWSKGLIRTSGQWHRADKKLVLDSLAIAGIEYTLPKQWREKWMTPLPAWLSAIEVKKIDANRNLLIDINPDFPFQLTSLEGCGSNLLLARDHQWGVWGGNFQAVAAEATFNRIDLRHPSVTLTADKEKINISELSAFVNRGILECSVTLSQQPQRDLQLNLSGRQIPPDLLYNWGWPTVLDSTLSDVQLTLQGNLTAGKSFRDSMNGTLIITANEQRRQQQLQAGQVVTPLVQP
ncbi:MAG: hypothetical protein XXXJIFNMEKO3_03355 [Candidatus Erwinia impunctatus]|nr:hypothetical protein XXXJIFNMEKO_03355 [Culicoides impunctatus]